MSDSLLWTDGGLLLSAVLLIVGALLPVVNPLGNVPIFLRLTHGCDDATRRDLARHVALYSFGLLLGSMLLGSFVLRLFDLSIPVVQVAGGAVVVALGWNLLHSERPAADGPRDPNAARQAAVARAFYPLTLPVSIGSAVVAASLLLAYRYAARVSLWLGNKGMEMFLRLSALIVLSIGVQIVWNGMKALLAEIGIGIGS